MLALLSFVLLSTGALARELVLSPAQSIPLFANDSRSQLIAALKTVPWQASSLERTRSLLFMSGQSLDPEGRRVLNRIQLFERGRFDIWVMRQSVAGRGFDYKKWNRVAIAVDKSSRPFRAFYFQFGSEDGGESGVPRFKAFTAACLSCHSSGPRMIRPEWSARTEWTRALTPAENSLLARWNWRIQGYREVIDHNPKWRDRSMVEWDQPGDHDPVALPSCTQCHFAGSEVRGPLTRQNADSIRYLTHHHEMPIEDPALSPREQRCLDAWLERDDEALARSGCAPDGTLRKPQPQLSKH